MKYRVVIAHAPQDEAIASEILQALKKARVNCKYSVASGLRDAIAKAIDWSEAMVLVLSGASNDSEPIRWAVERAANGGKVIIPFRIDRSPLSRHLEFYLSTPHWLEASKPPLETHLLELVSTVKRIKVSRRLRAARRAISACIFGILSILLLGGLFGPLAVILGILELRSIKAGRSLRLGRKYAWIGITTGCLGFIGWTILMFHWWYSGENPSQGLINWLTGA